MGIQERKERVFKGREKEILQAALRLFDGDDWQLVTIERIAQEAEIGKGTVFLNNDVRWRFSEFRLRGKPAHLTLSLFYDVGRVWDEKIDVGEIAKGLHSGYGSGLRLGLGPSFTAAFDAARSPGYESTQIYIGLGYPF